MNPKYLEEIVNEPCNVKIKIDVDKKISGKNKIKFILIQKIQNVLALLGIASLLRYSQPLA